MADRVFDAEYWAKWRTSCVVEKEYKPKTWVRPAERQAKSRQEVLKDAYLPGQLYNIPTPEDNHPFHGATYRGVSKAPEASFGAGKRPWQNDDFSVPCPPPSKNSSLDISKQILSQYRTAPSLRMGQTSRKDYDCVFISKEHSKRIPDKHMEIGPGTYTPYGESYGPQVLSTMRNAPSSVFGSSSRLKGSYTNESPGPVYYPKLSQGASLTFRASREHCPVGGGGSLAPGPIYSIPSCIGEGRATKLADLPLKDRLSDSKAQWVRGRPLPESMEGQEESDDSACSDDSDYPQDERLGEVKIDKPILVLDLPKFRKPHKSKRPRLLVDPVTSMTGGSEEPRTGGSSVTSAVRRTLSSKDVSDPNAVEYREEVGSLDKDGMLADARALVPEKLRTWKLVDAIDGAEELARKKDPFSSDAPDLEVQCTFGVGCSLEEHILYGMCLDGKCAQRSHFERGRSRELSKTRVSTDTAKVKTPRQRKHTVSNRVLTAPGFQLLTRTLQSADVFEDRGLEKDPEDAVCNSGYLPSAETQDLGPTAPHPSDGLLFRAGTAPVTFSSTWRPIGTAAPRPDIPNDLVYRAAGRWDCRQCKASFDGLFWRQPVILPGVGHFCSKECRHTYTLKGAADMDSDKVKPQPALLFAAVKGELDAVDKLLCNGVDPTIKDLKGRTALHKAASNGHYRVVRRLMRGAFLARVYLHCIQHHEAHCRCFNPLPDLDARDSKHSTPLSMATQRGHSSVVQLLVKAGANVDLPDLRGKAALALSLDQETFQLLRAGGKLADTAKTMGRTLYSRKHATRLKSDRMRLMSKSQTASKLRETASAYAL